MIITIIQYKFIKHVIHSTDKISVLINKIFLNYSNCYKQKKFEIN